MTQFMVPTAGVSAEAPTGHGRYVPSNRYSTTTKIRAKLALYFVALAAFVIVFAVTAWHMWTPELRAAWQPVADSITNYVNAEAYKGQTVLLRLWNRI